jgi:hypothetical protein
VLLVRHAIVRGYDGAEDPRQEGEEAAMTVDELFKTLSMLTKLKNGRDLEEHRQPRGPEKFPTIDAALVDETLRQLEMGSYLERMVLLERLADEMPFDVVMVLNQRLVQRPAFSKLMRQVNETKTIYQTARQAFLEGYTNGAEDALKTGQDEAISDEHAKQGFERWWRTQAIPTHRPSS